MFGGGATQAAGEGAPWACRALFEGASCAMSDDWLLQQRRLQRVRQQQAAERARDAAAAAATQVRSRVDCKEAPGSCLHCCRQRADGVPAKVKGQI